MIGILVEGVHQENGNKPLKGMLSCNEYRGLRKNRHCVTIKIFFYSAIRMQIWLEKNRRRSLKAINKKVIKYIRRGGKERIGPLISMGAGMFNKFGPMSCLARLK